MGCAALKFLLSVLHRRLLYRASCTLVNCLLLSGLLSLLRRGDVGMLAILFWVLGFRFWVLRFQDTGFKFLVWCFDLLG